MPAGLAFAFCSHNICVTMMPLICETLIAYCICVYIERERYMFL